MRLSRWIPYALVWIPLLDLGLAGLIAVRLGGPRTLLWLLGTCVFGVFLALGGGLAAPRGPRGEAVAPDAAWIQARLLRWVAGVLWLWPGPLTDLAGAVLLIPPLRRLLLGRIWSHLASRGFVKHFGFDPYRDGSGPQPPPSSAEPRREGPIRDVEFEVLDPDGAPPDEDVDRPGPR